MVRDGDWTYGIISLEIFGILTYDLYVRLGAADENATAPGALARNAEKSILHHSIKIKLLV